jgi:hypothetical protein
VEERGGNQGAEVTVDANMDTNKEPVPNQPYSENTVSPLSERATSLRLPYTHSYAGAAADAPEVYVAPPSLPPLSQSDIDQEIRMIEVEEAQIRLQRETHQEVLQLQLEEERLRTRKAELVTMRN